jgi:cellulose synthase/poly-beta-1,6-N-acetylglucosamine synthase-like glycosyltransferase
MATSEEMRMPSSHPFFSVIIPTYNRAQMLLQTIDSVNRQKFDDFELIVINDALQTTRKNSLPKGATTSPL